MYWQRTERTGAPTPGSIARTWSASSASIAGSGSLVRASGSTIGPPQSWAALTVRLAVGREAVERRVVHPDPQRERPANCVGCSTREVGDLLQRHLERNVQPEVADHVVDPRVGATTTPRQVTSASAVVDPHAGLPQVLQAEDGGVLAQLGAERRARSCSTAVVASGRHDRGVGLEQPQRARRAPGAAASARSPASASSTS